MLARTLAAVLLLSSSIARAQVMGEPPSPYPDARKFARGLYGEAEAGAVVFIGDAQGSMGPGIAFGARLGYDIVRWVAFQIRGVGSTHTTDFAGPQSGQLLQVYAGTAELKLTIPLEQWSIFGFGGGGYARLSTNLLGTTGLTGPNVRTTPVFGGGLGVDYHTLSRHFSFGLTAAFSKFQEVLTTGAVTTTLYLRYTF